MQLKEKGWIWKLTGLFASNNYTTIGDTIYYPKGFPPSEEIVCHEETHRKQQKEVGFIKFTLLYLFAFPVLWNPWRWKWEREAQRCDWPDDRGQQLLRSYHYGWLIFNEDR